MLELQATHRRTDRSRRWTGLAVALALASLAPQTASAQTGSPGPTTPSEPSSPVAAGAIDPGETSLPTLPLPPCGPGNLAVSDTIDCEGASFDYAAVDPNVPRPSTGALTFTMNSRTLDFRKDADRAAPQTVTFTWAGPIDQTATVGGRTYTSRTRFIWPNTIEGGETNIGYLKRRIQGGLWSPETEGAPYGSSSNPPRVLFERTGACDGPQLYSAITSCTYKVTWGDYGQRVQKPMIFRVGIQSQFSYETVNAQGFADCGGTNRCGFLYGAGFTTFRTDPPAPLVVDAKVRRLGPKQFEFDATDSRAPTKAEIASFAWSLPAPAITSTQGKFTVDFDQQEVPPFFNGSTFSVMVKDRWGRAGFGFVPFSFLEQVGTEGPLKIKTVTVKSVTGGTATLELIVENTTGTAITKAGIIAKRTPSSNQVRTFPADQTVPANGTATYTVTAPVDALTEFDVQTQGFGTQGSSAVKSAAVTTRVVAADAPGPNCTPGQPVATSATATAVTLTTPKGSCATTGAGAPTGLRLLGYAGSSSTASITKDLAVTSTSTEVTGLTAGTRYRFRLVAVDAEGTGPNGTLSAWALPPFPTLDSFTNRQHLDFAGRAATTAERSAWASSIGAGTLTPAAAIDQAVDFVHWAKQSPNIRLYQAYFKRLPDASGLTYWSNKSRTGTSIYKISSTFAASSEFTSKYGSLTNRQFVELVYQNVLGRPGDAGGISYWTAKLDAKAKNRGEVMVGFSESNEYKTKTKALVDVVNVFTGMLRRVPTTTEISTWQPQLASGTSRATLVSSLLASAAYDARVP